VFYQALHTLGPVSLASMDSPLQFRNMGISDADACVMISFASELQLLDKICSGSSTALKSIRYTHRSVMQTAGNKV
jgi:hypothetical protein